MSDAPQGPGWWQASDGRWYPPTQTPARPDLPPPPAPTWPTSPTPPPAAAPTPPAKKRSKAGDTIGVIFVVIMGTLIVMCAFGAFSSEDSSSVSGADASAQVACGHFRNVANDAAKGILGTDQLLPKMREVYDSASVSDNIRVRTAAQQLLAAVTADQDASTQVQEMSAACTAIGE